MFGITAADAGVFLLSWSAPAILFWLFGAIRGRVGSVMPSALAVMAVFALGMALILHGRF